MIKEASLQSRILILDDEPANVLLLEKTLRREGYGNLRSFTDAKEFLAAFPSEEPDLILLDLTMPGMSGFDVMDRLKSLIPEDTFLPILVLTADATPQAKQNALGSLATDFLTKPFDKTEVLLRIRNLLLSNGFVRKSVARLPRAFCLA